MELIVEQGNDFLITVKKNQPKLRNCLQSAFETQSPLDVSTSNQTAHGRQIERRVTILEPPDEIDPEWVGIKRVIRVERNGIREEEPFSETMFYITSLERSAQELAQLVREHWHVENRLHWPKDVVLKEDSTLTCDGRAIEGFAILRTLVVNLFRANGYQSITEALDLLAHDIRTLFSFLN